MGNWRRKSWTRQMRMKQKTRTGTIPPAIALTLLTTAQTVMVIVMTMLTTQPTVTVALTPQTRAVPLLVRRRRSARRHRRKIRRKRRKKTKRKRKRKRKAKAKGGKSPDNGGCQPSFGLQHSDCLTFGTTVEK